MILQLAVFNKSVQAAFIMTTLGCDCLQVKGSGQLCKNKVEVGLETVDGQTDCPFLLWTRKFDIPGAALCIVCNRVLHFGVVARMA